jgi:mannose-binding lectin 2
MVHSLLTYSFLLSNSGYQQGWLWSRLALTPSNFVIEVEFKVTGDSSHLFGDGLAMWLTKERAQPGPVFGSKGTFLHRPLICIRVLNAFAFR